MCSSPPTSSRVHFARWLARWRSQELRGAAVAFKTSIDDAGIGELIFDHPPVNAFDSAGWFELARTVTDLNC